MEFRQIVNAFESAGYEVRSYCGRGMRHQCLGIDCDDTNRCVLEAVACFIENQDYSDDQPVLEFIGELKNLRTDSMGLGSIVYFPNIKWEGKSDEDSDDDEVEETGEEEAHSRP